jgi:hypothetical protein
VRAAVLIRLGTILVVTALVAAGCLSGSAKNESESRSSQGPPHPLELTDVAHTVGLDFQQGVFHWEVSPDPGAMLGGGICWLDYDEDGWLDLFAVNSYAEREVNRWEDSGGLPRTALFHNVEGKFTDVSY